MLGQSLLPSSFDSLANDELVNVPHAKHRDEPTRDLSIWSLPTDGGFRVWSLPAVALRPFVAGVWSLPAELLVKILDSTISSGLADSTG
jgi:hypothetical protein